MSQDRATRTAFDPAAPSDERTDALGALQRDYLPAPSDLLPGGAVAEVINYIQDQYATRDALLAKAQVIPFPGRPRRKTGMQSVSLDPLQVMAYGSYFERPAMLGMEAMRAMVEQTPVLNAVILTRIRQVSRFCVPQEGDTGPGFQIAHLDPEHKLTADEQQFRRWLSRFFEHSGREFNPVARKRLRRDPFATFVAKLVRESLTYDAAAIETERTEDRRGLTGFYAVDGSTIRLCSDEGYDGDDQVFAVQVVTGQVVTAYTMSDLIYEPRNPRADVRTAGYGLGETELLVRVVTGFLNAMTHNSKGFDDNSIPRGILHLTGEYSETELQAFKRYWNAMVRGVQNTWTLPVLTARTPDAKASFERLGVDFDEMHFSKWMTFLVSIICAVYGMSPAEINFDSFTAGNTSALSGSDTDQKLAASKDSGMRPLLSYLQGLFSDYLVTSFGASFCFRWTGLEPEDPIRKDELRKALLTVNELRAQEGYGPMAGPLGDAPVNPSLIGPWMQLQQGPEGGEEGQQPPAEGADQPDPDGDQADDAPDRPRPRKPSDDDGRDDRDPPRRPKARDPGDQAAQAAAATPPGEWGQLAKANPNHDELGRFARLFARARQPGETRGLSGAKVPLTVQQLPALAETIAGHLQAIPPIRLPDRGDQSARKDALVAARKTSAWMREHRMAIHNARSGALLELSLRGLKHAKVMSGDLRAAMLLYKLPSVLAQAVYVKSERPDPRKHGHENIVAYHKFAVPVVSRGNIALALLHVEEDRRGKFYYDASITPEIKRLDGTSGASAPCEGGRETCLRQAYIQHILAALEVKLGLSETHIFLRKALGADPADVWRVEA